MNKAGRCGIERWTLVRRCNAKSRVFHIGPSETVTISGLTIADGNAHGEFFPDVRGGGLTD